MDAIQKKALLMRLYKTTATVQATIEEELDSLVKNGNTKEFDIILLNLVEISIQLLRGNY